MLQSHDHVAGAGAHMAQTTVPILLRGGRVTASFRDAVFRAANRSGMSVNEWVLFAAGQQLRASGATLPGVFEPGDIDIQNSADLRRSN